MEYIILSLIIILLIFLVVHHLNKRKLKAKIEKIRSEWGKAKTDSFQFDRIRMFADTVKENNFHRLTDQTIEDIDFYSLFAFIDRTVSKVGQQFLFKKVITPTGNIEAVFNP